MAAEAPITAKKGEYSGLSSEDILALFSGAATTTKGYDYVRLGGKKCRPFPGPKTTSFIVTGRERRRAEEGGLLSPSKEDRCSGGKWRNGKSHVTESISGASICVRAGVNAGVPVLSEHKTARKVLFASLENLRGTTLIE